MIADITFRAVRTTPAERDLRLKVRSFLTSEFGDRLDGDPEEGDRDFSLALAKEGYVGMALPTRYGGSGRSAMDRWIITEELLAVGAPLGGHWSADRQSGPLILRFGSESLCEEFLPRIARGDCWFVIGMSEADAGSDLASVRTRATPVDGGWIVNGTKTWTSGAHNSDYMLTLCRTSGESDNRHRGLSQLIIDLHADGVAVRPIEFMDGSHPYNDVVLTDVFVPDNRLVGQPGSGWDQVTSELTFERAGPERYMVVFRLLGHALQARADILQPSAAAIGELVSRLSIIRQMSMHVVSMIDVGKSPAFEAALVKDLSTIFERDVVDVLSRLTREQPQIDGAGDQFERLLARLMLHRAVFTIAGGSTEILRSVVAKGLR